MPCTLPGINYVYTSMRSLDVVDFGSLFQNAITTVGAMMADVLRAITNDFCWIPTQELWVQCSNHYVLKYDN